MNNKFLGAIALIGAPFLFIGYMVEESNKHLSDSWFTGMWGFIYISAWMFSIVALQKARATGESRFGRIILWVVMTTLSIANISNIYQWVMPDNKPWFFFYIDLCWPLSNVLMLVVGITVIAAKRLDGWRRFIPLIVGLWLPVAIGSLVILGRTPFSLMIGATYSLIAWALLAIMVGTTPERIMVRHRN